MRQLDGTGLKRLHRTWRKRTAGRLAVVLDGLMTPVNVGSITRSAAAFDVDELWLAGPTPPPWAGGAVKVAMGTEKYLQVHQADSGPAAVAAAKASGYAVYALELTDDAQPLHEVAATLPADVALVVGHEDHGVGKATLAACDGAVYVPLLGRVGSLNVAVAGAIAVYELRRSRWAGGDRPGAVDAD